MADSFRIRPTVPADLAAVTLLEQAAFSDPWTSEMLSDILTDRNAITLAALDGEDRLIGSALGHVVADEGELLSIAVDPDYRGKGLGRLLLDRILTEFVAVGAASVWLEVRAGNEAAKALYRAAGFQQAGIRRGYYRRPPEDALVLSWRPPAPSGTPAR